MEDKKYSFGWVGWVGSVKGKTYQFSFAPKFSQKRKYFLQVGRWQSAQKLYVFFSFFLFLKTFSQVAQCLFLSVLQPWRRDPSQMNLISWLLCKLLDGRPRANHYWTNKNLFTQYKFSELCHYDLPNLILIATQSIFDIHEDILTFG